MRLLQYFLLISTCLILLGCGEEESKSVNTSKQLTILSGSELKDLKPMLGEIQKNTGIELQFEYIGTLDGAEKIVNNQGNYDLAWFSHAKYLSLLQGQQKKILAQEKIGISPVIPAVKRSEAEKWGWINNPNITWADIADKVAAGKLRYAMTDPTASNTGFSTVMGVQAAFSGSSDVITAKDVDVNKLKQFFSGQKLTSGSSGWLAEAYIRDQNKLNGLFNYESVILSLNNSNKLREKLVLIYPKEGVVTADYPLILLNEQKREAYTKLVTYLKTKEFQNWMMQNTNRRPVTTQVKPDQRFPKGYLIELPFPNNIDTVNEILFSYLDKYRRPSHSYFVLDISGSMGGGRLDILKQAVLNLAGDDQSISGQFARFRNREKVTFITFNDEVRDIREIQINIDAQNSQGMDMVRQHVSSLEARGGTAVYDALVKAYEMAQKASEQDPNRFYSIVLMSDGISNNGRSFLQFEQFYRNNADYIAQIRTFPVLFGESDDKEMKLLAERTGGRVFDSRKHSLAHVFKKIRGYQ